MNTIIQQKLQQQHNYIQIITQLIVSYCRMHRIGIDIKNRRIKWLAYDGNTYDCFYCIHRTVDKGISVTLTVDKAPQGGIYQKKHKIDFLAVLRFHLFLLQNKDTPDSPYWFFNPDRIHHENDLTIEEYANRKQSHLNEATGSEASVCRQLHSENTAADQGKT